MITGAHAIIYSKNAEADRAFLRDVLGFNGVDAGRGWLIFALPPSEVAVHPWQENGLHELHLMCSDLSAELKALAIKGATFTDIKEEGFGSIVKVNLPGGGQIGLYQPRHKTAVALDQSSN